MRLHYLERSQIRVKKRSKNTLRGIFADVLDICQAKLTAQEQEVWIPRLAELTSRNLDRIQEDIDWLIEKYDYRNRDADWKESRDAVQRTMQKLTGGHPADPVFQNRK